MASLSVEACAVPRKGYRFTLDELIDKTDQIVLATFKCNGQPDLLCGFHVLEALKGAHDPIVTLHAGWAFYAIPAIREKHPGAQNDFSRHTESGFWSQTSMRSSWKAGSCYPALTFTPGRNYLVFIDSPASPYAAELIKSADDEWLRYVRYRLTNGA